MRIIAATTAEAQILRARWQAITRVLGTAITLEAVAPDGQVINHQAPEATASTVRPLIAAIQAHLTDGPAAEMASDLAQQQPQAH